MVAGDHQFSDLYLLRLQLLQAADEAGLALVQRLQRILGGAVHRDVRLSADDISAIGMATEQLPRCRLVLPRCRPPFRDDVRLEGQSALWPLPPAELRLYWRRVHPDFGRLEGALPGSAASDARRHRHLLLYPPSAISRVHPGDVRLPAAMADPAYPRNVSGALLHVCAARPYRGARDPGRVRSRISALHEQRAKLHPT